VPHSYLDASMTPRDARAPFGPAAKGAGERIEQIRWISRRDRQRFSTISRATLPLGPKGFCGLPLSSALTPPALPRVSVNWS
jgi:hypothetical protein